MVRVVDRGLTQVWEDLNVSGQYRTAGIEPPLQEVMDDEVTHLVMRRDRLSADIVWAHVESARAVLRARTAMEEDTPRKCA